MASEAPGGRAVPGFLCGPPGTHPGSSEGRHLQEEAAPAAHPQHGARRSRAWRPRRWEGVCLREPPLFQPPSLSQQWPPQDLPVSVALDPVTHNPRKHFLCLHPTLGHSHAACASSRPPRGKLPPGGQAHSGHSPQVTLLRPRDCPRSVNDSAFSSTLWTSTAPPHESPSWMAVITRWTPAQGEHRSPHPCPLRHREPRDSWGRPCMQERWPVL